MVIGIILALVLLAAIGAWLYWRKPPPPPPQIHTHTDRVCCHRHTTDRQTVNRKIKHG